MNLISVNGMLQDAAEAAISVQDRSYRYGDGIFETMRVRQGKILLAHLHFDRLFNSLALLNYDLPPGFTQQEISNEIIALCTKNNCTENGRIRLSVSGGTGHIYDADRHLHYVIEAQSTEPPVGKPGLNEIIDIFPDARKAYDKFSGLKSASALAYVMAARYAIGNHLTDCLVLNEFGRIADSSIANIFIIKDQELFTPPLSEACVSGVMRRFLLEQIPGWGFACSEKALTIEEIGNADEIFLCNAFRWIRPVRKFRDQVYTTEISGSLFQQVNQSI